MSLDARRKAKTPTTTAPAEAKAPKEKKVKKSGAVHGPMRTIALGRAYKEFTAILNDQGAPLSRTYFDPHGRGAKSITKETRKDRVLNVSALVQHINAEVCKPVFGTALRPKILRMLMDGMADQILSLVERDYKVKFPNLAVFVKGHRRARKARNPRTGEAVQVPARVTMSAKAARSAKVYLAQAAA